VGAKPSKQTPKDNRLKRNNPAAGSSKPFGGKKAQPFTKKKP
jgi:hypothetical protein